MMTWLADTYCVHALENGTALDPPEFDCVTSLDQYAAAVYWAVMTITSIGYGDIAATPGNAYEQTAATLLMLICSLLWGQVIGTFCGVIATFNPEQNAFRAQMDDLNRFMSQEDLPKEMRTRLREYFHQSKHLRFAHIQHRLLSQMPPNLKAEVAWSVSADWLVRIPFLSGASRLFMVDLSLILHAMVFAPGDTPPIGYLYIVHRGVALYRAKIITKGRVWGEDTILHSNALKEAACARAMNYLEVYYITRHELMGLAERYPTTYTKIRRFAVFMALKRKIVLMAKERLEEFRKHGSLGDIAEQAITHEYLANNASEAGLVGTEDRKSEDRMKSFLTQDDDRGNRVMSEEEAEERRKKHSEDGLVGGLPSSDVNPIEVIKDEMRDFRKLADERERRREEDIKTVQDAIDELRKEQASREKTILHAIHQIMMAGAAPAGAPAAPGSTPPKWRPSASGDGGLLQCADSTMMKQRSLSRGVMRAPEDRMQDGGRDGVKQSAGRRVLVRRRREHSANSQMRASPLGPPHAPAPRGEPDDFDDDTGSFEA